MSGSELWMVVEYNQASHYPEEAYGPYSDEGEAREAACQRAFDTSVLGRRECYQIGRLVLNDEVYDPGEYIETAGGYDPQCGDGASLKAATALIEGRDHG